MQYKFSKPSNAQMIPYTLRSSTLKINRKKFITRGHRLSRVVTKPPLSPLVAIEEVVQVGLVKSVV